MWKAKNLGSYKIFFFLRSVRKSTTFLEIFFKMLESIQWFVATGEASSKKKKKKAESHWEQYYEPNVCFLSKVLCWIGNLKYDVIWT